MVLFFISVCQKDRRNFLYFSRSLRPCFLVQNILMMPSVISIPAMFSVSPCFSKSDLLLRYISHYWKYDFHYTQFLQLVKQLRKLPSSEIQEWRYMYELHGTISHSMATSITTFGRTSNPTYLDTHNLSLINQEVNCVLYFRWHFFTQQDGCSWNHLLSYIIIVIVTRIQYFDRKLL